MSWAIVISVGLLLNTVGAVVLAWGLIYLPPAGWAGGAIGGGGTFPADHPVQRQQRRQRQIYRAAGALLVLGFLVQIVGVIGAEW